MTQVRHQHWAGLKTGWRRQKTELPNLKTVSTSVCAQPQGEGAARAQGHETGSQRGAGQQLRRSWLSTFQSGWKSLICPDDDPHAQLVTLTPRW